MDGRAFCTPRLWQQILQSGGWSTSGLRDGRYDLVLHLVTAANGAEEYYTTANNLARTETQEEARAQDDKLLHSWLGHPRHKIIDNRRLFQDKLDRALQPILQLVGVGTQAKILRFHLRYQPPEDYPVPKTTSFITITTLRCDVPSQRNRLYHKRESDGHGVVCSHQILRRTPKQGFRRASAAHSAAPSATGDDEAVAEDWQQPGNYFVQRTEEPLAIASYNNMLGYRDPGHEVVEKMVTCFVYNNLKYELEQIKYPSRLASSGCVLLVEEDSKHSEGQGGDKAGERTRDSVSMEDGGLDLVPPFLRRPDGEVSVIGSEDANLYENDDALAFSGLTSHAAPPPTPPPAWVTSPMNHALANPCPLSPRETLDANRVSFSDSLNYNSPHSHASDDLWLHRQPSTLSSHAFATLQRASDHSPSKARRFSCATQPEDLPPKPGPAPCTATGLCDEKQ
ncbi:TRPL translocation defect protein 14 [Diplonema papillatum]|nr:TRPL translocation defect protein 14 [Diplonema papillatum]